MVRGSPGHGALKVGSCATPTREPGQVRKEAAVSGPWRVPRGSPGRSHRPGVRPSRAASTAGARSPPFSSDKAGEASERRAGLSGPVPPVPAADAGRGPGAGPRRPRADRRHPRGPPAPRVPVLRAAGDGQDLHRADPGQDGQLREGSHARTVRRLRAVRPDPRGHAPGRRGDRRRVARRRGRRPRASANAPHRARHGPREGLHHRRGAAAVPRGVRRAAEGLRGAAARRAVRPGHHRAAQDAGHHRGPVSAVRLPAAHHRGGGRPSRTHGQGRGA